MSSHPFKGNNPKWLAMGYGGAPPWVYKKREVDLTSSYESQVSQLRDEVKKLEAENTRLRNELEEANRKYLECRR